MNTDIPMTLAPAAIEALSQVTTATLTTILLKKGLRNVWLRGTRPLRDNQPRLVGRAFTLRFVPAREDLATPASWASPISTRATTSPSSSAETQPVPASSRPVDFSASSIPTTKSAPSAAVASKSPI